MCKVLTLAHGELISVKNNGDVLCFKLFKDAYAYALSGQDLLGPVDLIEVNGAPPGNQSPGLYSPDEKDAIAKDLWFRTPFCGDTTTRQPTLNNEKTQ